MICRYLIYILNIQFKMFEDSRQTNRFEITRNEKENTNNNKLISYFQNSTFLAQQEELSTFIKNLPLIKF